MPFSLPLGRHTWWETISHLTSVPKHSVSHWASPYIYFVFLINKWLDRLFKSRTLPIGESVFFLRLKINNIRSRLLLDSGPSSSVFWDVCLTVCDTETLSPNFTEANYLYLWPWRPWVGFRNQKREEQTPVLSTLNRRHERTRTTIWASGPWASHLGNSRSITDPQISNRHNCPNGATLVVMVACQVGHTHTKTIQKYI